jgi:selenide, water dikinase
MAAVALTSLSHGAGCGCKLPAAELLPIVAALDAPCDERLLVGAATADDAAVYELAPGVALVQTVDFFTPIVDDPYDFGRIAATNALSDVYAMGGTPLTALNLVAFPLDRLGGEVLGEILQGGLDAAAGAGCTVVGGHSIDDPEPKYGMAVTGTVDTQRMLRNDCARAGDVLVLTKPLGVGAITTGRKRGEADDGMLAAAVETMSELNSAASAAALAAGARAATDVTGFGLLGHLHSMALHSGVAAEIEAVALPVLDGAGELLQSGVGVSGGTRRNFEHACEWTDFSPALAEWHALLACDATTSGGLLVSVDPDSASAVPGAVIGRVMHGEAGAVRVT